MSQTPDDSTVQRAREGDPEAMKAVLAQVAPAVHRFGMRMCRHDADADDVLQDTLLAIARNLPAFEGKSSLTSWVFTLARTACSRKRRGLKNKPMAHEDDAPEPTDEAPTPEQETELRQMRSHLAEALEKIPESLREAVLLRDVEQLSAADAAAALGITVEALKSRLHRGRAALREALTKHLEPQPSCPDVAALWSQKLEGDLRPVDCAEMERHLAGCRQCTDACSELQNALTACRSCHDDQVTPEMQERIRRAVEAMTRRA